MTDPNPLSRICAELEGLLEKATPGPWRQNLLRLDSPETDPASTTIYPVDAKALVRGASYVALTTTDTREPDRAARAAADARLIVVARNALPALLQAIREQAYSAFVDARGNELRCSSAVYQEVQRLQAEVVRLNNWADGFSDRQLEERRTGELYERELRAKIEDLDEDRLHWSEQCHVLDNEIDALKARAEKAEARIVELEGDPDLIETCAHQQIDIERLQKRVVELEGGLGSLRASHVRQDTLPDANSGGEA